MKVLLTLLSSTSLTFSSFSYIVSCDNQNIIRNSSQPIPDEAIGPPLDEEENYFKWLGEIQGERFDPELAGNLVVDENRKVVINNVNGDLVVAKLNMQSTANGGNLYEAVYDQLREVYGINIRNEVGRYTDFNIFQTAKESKDGEGNLVWIPVFDSWEWIANDYGFKVTTGVYRVDAVATSIRVYGSFEIILELKNYG